MNRRSFFWTVFGAALAPAAVKALPKMATATPCAAIDHITIPIHINILWGQDFVYDERELRLENDTILRGFLPLMVRFDPARLPA